MEHIRIVKAIKDGITVGKLIELLQKHDPNLPVIYYDGDMGYQDVSAAEEKIATLLVVNTPGAAKVEHLADQVVLELR